MSIYYINRKEVSNLVDTGYYTTNSVKVLLTQKQCKQMLFMCKSINDICEEYMNYCWKQFMKGKKLDRNDYYRKHLKPLYLLAKDDPENPYHYARQFILNNYFSRIELMAKRIYQDKRPEYNVDFMSYMSTACVNVNRLTEYPNSFLTLPACANDLTISKVNKHGTISINGIGKKVPLDSEFKESFLGVDKVTWMVFTIKHKKGSLLSVRLTLICGTQKNPYFDKEGFYQLLEKGKKHGKGN